MPARSATDRPSGVLAWIPPVVAVVRRPDLWPTGLAVVLRLARPRWWRAAPFLPLPDRDYWSFRATTAFGAGGGAPTGDEAVAYLAWCRAWPAVTRD